MVKKHESTINTIKATYDELKKSIESVRNSASSISLQECDDLRQFDSLITQLKERWEKASSAYTLRRGNLKKCLYNYHEYIKSLNNEKQSNPTSINTANNTNFKYEQSTEILNNSTQPKLNGTNQKPIV